MQRHPEQCVRPAPWAGLCSACAVRPSRTCHFCHRICASAVVVLLCPVFRTRPCRSITQLVSVRTNFGFLEFLIIFLYLLVCHRCVWGHSPPQTPAGATALPRHPQGPRVYPCVLNAASARALTGLAFSHPLGDRDICESRPPGWGGATGVSRRRACPTVRSAPASVAV